LDRVVTALAGMHERLTPNPSDVAAPAAEGLRSVFGGWRILADGDTDGTGLNEWSRRHLGRLAALESAWPEACAGDTLLHVDLRSDNMLLTHDSVVFVDWPHAAVGPPVLDVLAWAPSVNLEGGPDPDELLARHPAARSADPEVVTVLVAALAGFLVQRSLLPPPPGLPTLRAFQGAQGEVALRWLRRRTGW
jgi:aminoglycoside phosphotransferase (APT) family kinase protein